jgi:hypothetical protein
MDGESGVGPREGSEVVGLVEGLSKGCGMVVKLPPKWFSEG